MNITRKKIWIDLENSPHVPFFNPIITELESRGYELVITARDCFQVCGLADLFGLRYVRIGRHYGKRKILKVIGLIIRTIQLAPIVLRYKPELTIAHGSRSQLLLASILGIPSVQIGDYEFSKDLPFIYPTWVIAPEVIPNNRLKHGKGILKYPGIKEDVYTPSFKPDARILDKLGINGKDIVVTIRPPATEAHYHNPESEELFRVAIDFICRNEKTRIVLLLRDDKQAVMVRKTWPEWLALRKIIIPDDLVNGLNIVWFSDLVISGGGTMNREAAALGVPVYSIFRGKIGAVDKYLSDCGKLTLLKNIEDVRTRISLARRNRPTKPTNTNNKVLRTIVNEIIGIMEKK